MRRKVKGLDLCIMLIGMLAIMVSATVSIAGAPGDCNDNGVHDYQDAEALFNILFTNSESTCSSSKDCNGDGRFDVSDVICVLSNAV